VCVLQNLMNLTELCAVKVSLIDIFIGGGRWLEQVLDKFSHLFAAGYCNELAGRMKEIWDRTQDVLH